MSEHSAHVRRLTQNILNEIFKAFGLSAEGPARKLLWPIFWAPAHKFSELAARFEQQLERGGISGAMHWVLPQFIERLEIRGEQYIPREGPLLVASNHPGTVDSIAISASLHREDLKIVAVGIPFLKELPVIKSHLIYTSDDTHERMGVVRSAIRHLKEGGALLIFPSGTIDPDPSVLPGAAEALEKWSPSVELFLRKVPQTRLLLTIVSGVLSPGFLRNPLVRRKSGVDQRRLAEFLQVMQQLFFPKSLRLTPKIAFEKPLTLHDLISDVGEERLIRTIVQRAKQLLSFHYSSWQYE